MTLSNPNDQLGPGVQDADPAAAFELVDGMEQLLWKFDGVSAILDMLATSVEAGDHIKPALALLGQEVAATTAAIKTVRTQIYRKTWAFGQGLLKSSPGEK